MNRTRSPGVLAGPLCTSLLLACAASCSPPTCAVKGVDAANVDPSNASPHNVILMLSDGTGPEAWTLARWVKGTALNADGILTGAVRTYGADSIITDSAPGATAYSTARKGSDKGIAVGPWKVTIAGVPVDSRLAYAPLVTLLEGAKVSGYATGLIATSNIQHATPAAFSAHVADRNQYEEIAEQQVYQGIDVVLSGGEKYLLPKTHPGGARADGENLVEVLERHGYGYVTTKQGMLGAPSARLWGIFAPNDMAYEVDRARFAPQQPSLAEMTHLALSKLAAIERAKSRGLFLFIEGSKVDWAAHANDPVGVVSELLAFDDAIGVALEFAKKHANTQVIVVADHGTGGITIGSNVDSNYSKTDDDAVVGPLRRAKMSAERLVTLLSAQQTSAQIAETMRREWGIDDLTSAELASLEVSVRSNTGTADVLSHVISSRARIGWTTSGHTGADVMLFAYGPSRPAGLVENTEIGAGIARFLGLELATLQKRLYVDAGSELVALGYAVNVNRTDPNNGELEISTSHGVAVLPFSKNLLIVGGEPYELEGIVVHSEKLDRTYVPTQVIDVIRQKLGRAVPGRARDDH